jgi:predicted CopG family antitoxin
MSRDQMATRSYHLKMPEEAYEQLLQMAKSERRVLADVIRLALEEYTKNRGYDINFEVERGRPRLQTSDEGDAE